VDNLDTAIYSMLNELAARHGLRPCDFRAVFGDDDRKMCHSLTFTDPAASGEQMLNRYKALLIHIGIGPNDGQKLVGSAEGIYSALEHALAVVPKRGRRSR
jgi:hypothetical protein